MGPGEPGGHVAVLAVHLRDDVALRVGEARDGGILVAVHERSARPPRLLGVEDGGQDLVVDAHQAHGRLRDPDVVGDHRGHALPAEPHHVVEDAAVVGVVEAVLVPRGRVERGGGVVVGEHGVHARQRERLRRVDGADARVRVRAADQARVQEAGDRHVERVRLGAADDALARGRVQRRADAAGLGALGGAGAVGRRGGPAAAVADPVARTGPSPSGRSPPQPAECAWAAPPCSPRIASSMARYPVHRQRLLFITRGRSSRSPSPSDAAVTTMPGVQNPHWNPAASTNRSCTGCRSPGVPSPAAVVTSRPAARNAGRMHECTASPSRSTEHAPQSPESQPFFTLNTSCARSHVRRLWPGAGSPGISRPSTVMLTGVLLPSSWWRRPAGCRARRRAVRRRSPPPRRPAPRGSPPRAARSRHGASRRRRARR
ncbi:hypothetical protein CMMCAS02_10285 [Clavibacter michiganensis subsp. michiganensis]|nr:hypothetical protein CMMCAS02_10285 [Clavibacter michiganensis subsp. michiganensis]